MGFSLLGANTTGLRRVSSCCLPATGQGEAGQQKGIGGDSQAKARNLQAGRKLGGHSGTLWASLPPSSCPDVPGAGAFVVGLRGSAFVTEALQTHFQSGPVPSTQQS